MTTGVVAVTCRVVIEKETSWPAAVTLAGTDAAGELLASVTTVPLGAFPLNSSVPTWGVPPEKTFGVDRPSSFWLEPTNTWLRPAGSTVGRVDLQLIALDLRVGVRRPGKYEGEGHRGAVRRGEEAGRRRDGRVEGDLHGHGG